MAANPAQLLKDEGFAIWFDSKIYAGANWEAMLMETLQTAKAAVVSWSKGSVKRPQVLREAQMAKQTNRLIPTVVDDCTLPECFGSVQASLKNGGNGNSDDPRLERLPDGIGCAL